MSTGWIVRLRLGSGIRQHPATGKDCCILQMLCRAIAMLSDLVEWFWSGAAGLSQPDIWRILGPLQHPCLFGVRIIQQ